MGARGVDAKRGKELSERSIAYAQADIEGMELQLPPLVESLLRFAAALAPYVNVEDETWVRPKVLRELATTCGVPDWALAPEGPQRGLAMDVEDMELIAERIATGFVVGYAAQLSDAAPVEALGGIRDDARRAARKASRAAGGVRARTGGKRG